MAGDSGPEAYQSIAENLEEDERRKAEESERKATPPPKSERVQLKKDGEYSPPKKDDKLPQVEGEPEEGRAPTSEESERIKAIAERLAKNYPEVSPPMISSKTADGGGAVIPHRTIERWFQLEGWKKTGSRLNGGDAWVPPAAGVV